MSRALLLCALLVACKHEPQEQTFSEAMRLICDPPAGADPAYWRAHLQNVEAIKLFESIGELNPASQRRVVGAALAKAELKSCKLVDEADSRSHLPTVASAPGALEIDQRSPVVTASLTSIAVDGKKIVDIASGELPKLESYLRSVANVSDPGGAPLPRLDLELDPTLAYSLLVSMIETGKKAGWRSFGIVVRVGSTPKIIPIDLPDASQVAAAAPIGMVVAIKADEYDLWSLSGTEGTIQKPIAAATQATTIATALGEVITRHWATGTTRPAGRDRRCHSHPAR